MHFSLSSNDFFTYGKTRLVPIPTPPKRILDIVKPATPAAQPEEDPRFEIKIIGPQNESAQFKTRGKHPVRKVLAAACKTFGLKYERCVLRSFLLFYALLIL